MSTLQLVLLCLALMLSGTGQPSPARTDLAHLQEILHDKQDPRNQSQAALLLLQPALDANYQAVKVASYLWPKTPEAPE